MEAIRPIDWAVLWALAYRDMFAGGSGPEPMVPTMPHFSLLGRAFLPCWEKNGSDFPNVRISIPLMLVCSQMCISKEFSIFDVTFNASDGDSYEGWGLL